MEFEDESTIIGSASKNTLKMHKKIWIWKLDDQNISIQNKLKDKNYRGHNKSCLRMGTNY
jgi:hypothetical protein